MKKLFFIAAIASVALASCVKNEVAPTAMQQDEITFAAPVVGNLTKGIITGTDFTESTFNVYGWYCADAANGGSDAYDDTKAVEYMPNTTVTLNDTFDSTEDVGTGAWFPANTYYWPKNGKLTFDAYYPSDLQAPFGASATVAFDKKAGVSFSNVVVPVVLTNPTDLLYSNRTYDQVASTGAIAKYDGVDINFNHALSAVYFNVKALDDETVAGVRIKSLTVTAYNKGDFTHGITGTSGSYTPNPGWTVKTTETPVDYQFITSTSWTDAKALTTAGETLATYAILLPQTFDAKVKITIEYYIARGTDYTFSETKTYVLNNNYKDNSENAIDKWEMGKKYTYNFTFDFNSVYFAAAVDNWDSVDMKPFAI